MFEKTFWHLLLFLFHKNDYQSCNTSDKKWNKTKRPILPFRNNSNINFAVRKKERKREWGVISVQMLAIHHHILNEKMREMWQKEVPKERLKEYNNSKCNNYYNRENNGYSNSKQQWLTVTNRKGDPIQRNVFALNQK